ncbi:Lpg1974 family pore-forming outer membrane protein [Legionella sp. km772]|uniref:Lpg1974 family pore-forming outer membrane protein n=1 Tax=Legionella sp. km772 TaxID=2498111 RepID=UPI000F8E509B|nr:Lpg1974 family pore-forming outer membrane protein [Legionella sp. km772]RUR12582.1 hypothetical protein ELY15_04640 [Legionella sp. km772]
MPNKIIAFIAPIMLVLNPLAHATAVSTCDKDGLACERSHFDIGLTALYLKAYSDSLPSNAIANSNNSNTFGVDWSNTSGKGPWDWGGILDGRYHFSEQGDVNLSWMYYSVDYRGTDFSQNHYNTGTIGTNDDLNLVSGKIKLNAVNAEFAQSFDLSPRTRTRLFAGVQYLNIKNNFNTAHFSVSSDSESGRSSFTSNTFTGNKYEGVGPRVGLDGNYKLKDNFSLFASSAFSILLARSNQNVSDDSASLPFASASQSFRNTSASLSIPELEAKLGLTYDKPLAQARVALSAGWSVINYFNVLEGNDLTLSGPYLQAKWLA